MQFKAQIISSAFSLFHLPEPESTKVSKQHRNDPRLRNNIPWLRSCRTNKPRMHTVKSNFQNNRFTTSRKHCVSCKSSQRCKLPWTRSEENVRTSQTTVIVSNDEIPESNLYVSFIIRLSSFFSFVFLPNAFFDSQM